MSREPDRPVTLNEFREWEARMDARFQAVSARFMAVEDRFAGVDSRLDKLGAATGPDRDAVAEIAAAVASVVIQRLSQRQLLPINHGPGRPESATGHGDQVPSTPAAGRSPRWRTGRRPR